MKNIDIEYLLKENRKLRMEVKESNGMCQLHKQAVLDMSQQMGNNHQIIKILNEILRSSKQDAAKSRLRDQIFSLEGQVMVLQKIVNQTNDNEKQTYLLLMQQFNRMKEQNTKLELQLHKFYEKIGEVDYISGLVTKYKEIVSPNEFAVASKKEQDQLLDMLNLQREQIRKLTDEKQKLLKINVHMKEEVERKKDEVKNMTMMILNDDKNYEWKEGSNSMILEELQKDENHKKDPLESPKQISQHLQLRHNLSNLSSLNVTQGSPLNTTLNFVKLQRELIKEVDEQNYNEDSEDSQQFDCPELSILFPDKVQQIRTIRHEAKVPYLNMKKVRQLMTKRQQKMRKQIEAEGHHINPTNKIIQLQTQLEITRKQLTNLMLKFRLMQDHSKRMALFNQQLQNRVGLLAKSNQTLSNNYKNIYRDYQLCKSITNEVEKLLSKKILTEKNVLDVRDELSTIIMESNQRDYQSDSIQEDYRMSKLVSTIFKERPSQVARSLST